MQDLVKTRLDEEYPEIAKSYERTGYREIFAATKDFLDLKKMDENFFERNSR